MRFDCLFLLMRARHSTDDEVHPIDLSALGNLLFCVHGRSIGDERVVLALRMQLLAPPREQSSWELRVGHQAPAACITTAREQIEALFAFIRHAFKTL
jgi:hypothetical protein